MNYCQTRFHLYLSYLLPRWFTGKGNGRYCTNADQEIAPCYFVDSQDNSRFLFEVLPKKKQHWYCPRTFSSFLENPTLKTSRNAHSLKQQDKSQWSTSSSTFFFLVFIRLTFRSKFSSSICWEIGLSHSQNSFTTVNFHQLFPKLKTPSFLLNKHSRIKLK